MEDFECNGPRCPHEIVEKHYVLTEEQLGETRTAAYKEGLQAAVVYIEKNVVAIDKQPLNSPDLELDINEFAKLLEKARLQD